MKKALDILQLMRVKQWIKNLLIFVPMLCSRRFEWEVFVYTLCGFCAFSFLCSFIYIVNDWRDIEKDKNHPKKKNRPLPSGRISKKVAGIVAVLCLIVASCLGIVAGHSSASISLLWMLAYLVINLGYSFGLKNISIIDVFLLSAGFVVRIYYGASLADVVVSNWLFLTVASAAMLLAIGKRRAEAKIGKNVRSVLSKYSYDYLDKMMYVFLALIFVFYALWSMEQPILYLTEITVPLVILIFMRYLLKSEVSGEGDPTSLLFKDPVLLGFSGFYVVIMAVLFVCQ